MTSDENQSYATMYSAVSSRQFKTGCSFLETLGVNLGDKVLDMGCGTGELTKYIAEKVGKLGVVVGVDPDEARINVAKENMKMVSNASFHVGNSESSFLNDIQGCYDLHFSNHVYHWLSNQEKAKYVKVAFECLNPGGLIAFQCLVPSEDDINNRLFRSADVIFPEENSTSELLRACGFTEISVTKIPKTFYFNSFDEFSVCFLATTYKKVDELADEVLFEEFKTKSILENGKAKFEVSILQINLNSRFDVDISFKAQPSEYSRWDKFGVGVKLECRKVLCDCDAAAAKCFKRARYQDRYYRYDQSKC